MTDLFGYSRPVFGVTDPPQKASPDRLRTMKAVERIRYGIHPFGRPLANNGKTCADCAHCVPKVGHTKRFYKCKLRGFTSGPATDLRLKWPACERWEEK